MRSLMDSSGMTMIASLLILLVFSAYFSATETAFSSVNRVRIKNKAEDGNHHASVALSLLEDYERLLSCVLIANNIVNITAASIGTVLFTKLYPVYGATISSAVLTVVILIFGEITPKTMAKEHAEQFCMFSAPILRVFIVILTPLHFFFGLFNQLAAKLIKPTQGEGITEEELITMVEEAENEGGLEPHESELIRAAIEFNDLEVEEILTPRVDIVAVSDNTTMNELAALFAESGYSRIPVFHGTIDDIVGLIHEKDFYAARYHNQTNIEGLIGKVYYTTGAAKISELLRLLQRNKTHMAIVVDDYGGTEGLVTLEDILEELVGEIWDEHDEVIEDFTCQDDGSFIIACTANLSDLFDRFSLRGDVDSSSISGWVLEQLGRVPEEGDRFTYENLDVTVTRVDNRRILEIRVALIPNETDE